MCGHFVAILCGMRGKLIRSGVFSTLLTALVLAIAAAVAAQQTGTHPLSGRRYALTMGVEGAEWLDRAERGNEEGPDHAIGVLKNKKGSTGADIGAGAGDMNGKLAKKRGPGGQGFAHRIPPG